MQANRILDRHYTETIAACLRDEATDHHGALRANDCASLHVGLDAMSRVTRKRVPQAGYVARYPAIARRPAHEVTNGAVAILARHSQRVHDARTFGGDAKASLQATTVALVSVLR